MTCSWETSQNFRIHMHSVPFTVVSHQLLFYFPLRTEGRGTRSSACGKYFTPALPSAFCFRLASSWREPPFLVCCSLVSCLAVYPDWAFHHNLDFNIQTWKDLRVFWQAILSENLLQHRSITMNAKITCVTSESLFIDTSGF